MILKGQNILILKSKTIFVNVTKQRIKKQLNLTKRETIKLKNNNHIYLNRLKW